VDRCPDAHACPIVTAATAIKQFPYQTVKSFTALLRAISPLVAIECKYLLKCKIELKLIIHLQLPRYAMEMQH